MPLPAIFSSDGVSARRHYADAANGFVNRALARLPGFVWLLTATFAALVIMVVVGAFGTGPLPVSTRILFWSLLLGWNAVKWQLWLALMVRRPSDWWRAALLGTVLLNLPLPWEIDAALVLTGLEPSSRNGQVWLQALAISVVLFGILVLVRLRLRPAPAAPSVHLVLAPDGLLAKAGAKSPADLRAVVAEDHYCRVHLASGASPLVYFRFRDAMEEVASWDGIQVHRGAWVADAAVAGARRGGRRWILQLTTGDELPVSAQYVSQIRARGWHRRAPGAHGQAS